MNRVVILATVILSLVLVPYAADAKRDKAIDVDETERRQGGLTYKIGSEPPQTDLGLDP